MTQQQLNSNLLQAIENGQFEMGLKLIRSGADVNTQNHIHQTPLLIALQGFGEFGFERFFQRREFIEQNIIKYNSDVQATDDFGLQPLHLAAFNGLEGVCRLLLERGVNVNARAGQVLNNTPLLFATQNIQLVDHGDEDIMYEICTMLIQKGVDVNYINEEGKNALMEFAFNGNYKLCQLMVKSGAKVNVQDTEFGKNALLWATDLVPQNTILQNHTIDEWNQYIYNKRAICDLLISNGARLDLQDNEGHSFEYYVKGTEISQLYTKVPKLNDPIQQAVLSQQQI